MKSVMKPVKKRIKKRVTKLVLGLLPLLPLLAQASSNSGTSRSSTTTSDYQKALIRAQEKISREHLRGAQALTASTVSTLHRPYQVGDSWDVLSWNWSDLTPSAGRGAILHYEVTSTTPPGQVVMSVTQRANSVVGSPISLVVDPKVQSIQLTLQNLTVDSQREIHFQNRVVTLTGDTMPGNLSPLESYPFEFPDLRDVGTSSAAEDYSKEITPEALSAAQKAGFQLDPAHSMRLESQDTFGRPINVIWQRGDLWPTYVNTSHGFMFLLKNSAGAATDQNSGT
jgi:hypothetical protein